jgi:predicted nucleic acid-binding protein
VIALDTNLLFPALEPSHSDHGPARAFLDSLPGGIALSELVLMEVYVLVRNPVLVRRPLGPKAAVELIQALRVHPGFRLLDAPEGVMAEVWPKAAAPGFGRRRIFDARLAVSLLRQGVTDLATRNVRDFQGLGLGRVFDPLAES